MLSRTEAEDSKLLFGELTQRIIGVFYDVFNELGHGFLESVYTEAVCMALRDEGLAVEREVKVPVYFRAKCIGEYRADIIVESKVLLELKAVRSLDSSHEAQLLHYLRSTNIEVGLLLNFGPKAQFKRAAFSNIRKNPRESAKSAANGFGG